MTLWIVKRHLRATKALRVACNLSIIAVMQAAAVRRVPWPKERTAAIRASEGGEETLRVVARMMARWIDEILRFVVKVDLIKEDLSLKMSRRILSLFR